MDKPVEPRVGAAVRITRRNDATDYRTRGSLLKNKDPRHNDAVGEQGNGHSGFEGYLGLSRDGRAVSFESGATNLVNDDTNDGADVFVWRSL